MASAVRRQIVLPIAREERTARERLDAERAHVALLERGEQTVFGRRLAHRGEGKKDDFKLRELLDHHLEPPPVVRRDADEAGLPLFLRLLQGLDHFAAGVEGVAAARLVDGDPPQIGVFQLSPLEGAHRGCPAAWRRCEIRDCGAPCRSRKGPGRPRRGGIPGPWMSRSSFAAAGAVDVVDAQIQTAVDHLPPLGYVAAGMSAQADGRDHLLGLSQPPVLHVGVVIADFGGIGRGAAPSAAAACSWPTATPAASPPLPPRLVHRFVPCRGFPGLCRSPVDIEGLPLFLGRFAGVVEKKVRISSSDRAPSYMRRWPSRPFRRRPTRRRACSRFDRPEVQQADVVDLRRFAVFV